MEQITRLLKALEDFDQLSVACYHSAAQSRIRQLKGVLEEEAAFQARVLNAMSSKALRKELARRKEVERHERETREV